MHLDAKQHTTGNASGQIKLVWTEYNISGQGKMHLDRVYKMRLDRVKCVWRIQKDIENPSSHCTLCDAPEWHGNKCCFAVNNVALQWNGAQNCSALCSALQCRVAWMEMHLGGVQYCAVSDGCTLHWWMCAVFTGEMCGVCTGGMRGSSCYSCYLLLALPPAPPTT